MSAAAAVRAGFSARFGGAPRLFRAPGRINLIGEHTDYNDGWVLPAAIALFTRAAMAPRPGRRVRVYSSAVAEQVEFSLDDAAPSGPRWSLYLRGAAAELERAGLRLGGADVFIASELPLGGGLSSSAAFEMAFAFGLARLAGHDPDRGALAALCQRGDHAWVGVRCGIMDQFISARGQAGAALLLDTRDLSVTPVPLPPALGLLVCDSGVRHELAASAYNRRREECEAGVRQLAAAHPSVGSLRDATLEQLQSVAPALSSAVYRRCRHVLTENARVHAAVTALAAPDLPRFGELLHASHRSLRDDFEVSCRELDALVALCAGCPGVYGARLMGGGFGGCVLAALAPEAIPAVRARVAEGYQSLTGLAARIHEVPTASGVEEEC